MEIKTTVKVICNYCRKELNKDYISLDCNDTGYTNDEYTVDFCNIDCLKKEKLKDEKEYTKIELDEMSSFYMMCKYIKENGN